MYTVLFLDLTCPKPYNPEDLSTTPLGGTEATVIRVAEALAGMPNYRVVVAQHNRTFLSQAQATYAPFEDADKLSYDFVVVIRVVRAVHLVRERWPDAKLFLWLHTFNEIDLIENYNNLRDIALTVIGVSRTHKIAIEEKLFTSIGNPSPKLTFDFIYNAIADDLLPDPTPRDRNKLVFFSTPEKGLPNTLKMFSTYRMSRPEIRLYVANPGYNKDLDYYPEGVINLGSLRHAAVIQHVRQAACVLNLNDLVPETFGLVAAESLAVGTPFLTSGLGALPEVVSDPYLLVDPHDHENVAKKLDQIILHTPETTVNPEFRLSRVISRWMDIFQTTC